MKFTSCFLLILPIVTLLFFSFPSASNADWNGLDTLKIFHDEWDEINSRNGFLEWNGKLLIDTGCTGIWMMELDENDELQLIDSVAIVETYHEMRFLDSDTLYWESQNYVGKLLLTPSGFGEETIYSNPSHVAMLCYDGNNYAAINNGNWIHRMEFNDNTIFSVDSIQVENDETDEILFFELSESIIIASMYFDNGFYTSNTYTVDNNGFNALDTLNINCRFGIVIPTLYQGYLYFPERPESEWYLKKINPFNNTVEDSLSLPDRSLEMAQNGNILKLGYWDSSYNEKMVLVDFSTLEITGDYYLHFQTDYLPYLYRDDILIERYLYTGIADNVSMTFLRIESETELSEINVFYPENWSVADVLVEGDITYIANYEFGLKIVRNFDQPDMEVIDEILFENRIKRLIKNGDMLFVNTVNRPQYLLNCENVYDVTLVESYNLHLVPDDIETIGDMFVISSSYRTEIFSNDMQEQISYIPFNGEIEVKDSILYVLDDSLYIYDFMDPENPQLVTTQYVGRTPLYHKIVGDSLYLVPGRYGSGFSIYSLENPEEPSLLNTIDRFDNHHEFYPPEILEPYHDVFIGSQPDSGILIFDIEEGDVCELEHLSEDVLKISLQDRNGHLYMDHQMGFLICDENEFSSVENQSSNTLPSGLTYCIYPNPANAAASVSFNLDHSGEVGFALYNVLGQQVFWTCQVYTQGNHTYSLAGNMAALASGTYYLGITFGGQETVKKLTILK